MRQVQRSRRELIYMTVCIAILCCYFIANGIINFVGYPNFTNADMYADGYVAKLMWEQKTIFPENWVFGNQFYVLATPVAAAGFYGITGNINLSMALATTLMSVLIVISFWWMLKPFAKAHHILFGLLVLVGAVCRKDAVTTFEGQLFFSLASYYAIYLITLFVVFGDYSRSVEKKSIRWPALILSAILCFATGMQSLRQTVVMIFPLLLCEAIRLICIVVRTKKLPGKERLAPTLRVATFTAANLLGYFFIKILDPAHFTIYGRLRIHGLKQMFEAAKNTLKCLVAIIGIEPVYGERGPLAYILPPVLLLVVGIALFYCVFSRKRSMKGTSLLLVLCLFSLLSVMAVSSSVQLLMREIYLFVWYPMVAIAAVIILGKLKKWKSTTYFTLFTLLLVVNLCFGYVGDVKRSLRDETCKDRQIAEYLVDEGYEIIYGNWGLAADAAVWSDGKLTAGLWQYPCQALSYINALDIYSEEDNLRAVYLVARVEKDGFLQHVKEMSAEVELIKSFENGRYLIYTSDRQLMFME